MGARIFFHAALVILINMGLLHRTIATLAAALLTLPAQAQLRLPGGLSPLPSLPPVAAPVLPRLPELQSAGSLQNLRQQVVRELLREQAARVEADPAGEPVLRGELIVLAPSPALLAAAQAEGFRLLREQAFEGLGLRSVVLAPPAGLGTQEGLLRLRALDANAEIDFQHLYMPGGEVRTDTQTSAPAAPAAAARRVGLVDGGVDATHPSLRAARLQSWGCAGTPVPSAHGTAVASLLVGRDDAFAGVLPADTALYAADVYCGQAAGGAVETVVQALAWMAREQVAVINVSLVGPPNRLLAQAVRALAARGHLVVAAVGNDGPAAPPLYPAAYPEAIGVTGVAPSRRVLPEALRGPQVVFAAPGAEVPVAQSGSAAYAVARGTSFAAPLVAGSLAERLATPDPALARDLVERLAREATDLGAPGRDPVFGWGLVAERSRNRPDRVQAMRRARP